MGKLRRRINEYRSKRINEKFLKEIIFFRGNFDKIKKISERKRFNINYESSKCIYYAALVNGRIDLIYFLLDYYNFYSGATLNKRSYHYKNTITYIVENNQVEKFKIFSSKNFSIDCVLHNNGVNLVETMAYNNQIDMFKSLLRTKYFSGLRTCVNNIYHVLVKTNNLDMLILLVNFFIRNSGRSERHFGNDYLISNINLFKKINIFKYFSETKLFNEYEYRNVLNYCLINNNTDYLKKVFPIIDKNYKTPNIMYFYFLERCIEDYKPNIIKTVINKLDVNHINKCLKDKIIYKDDFNRLRKKLNGRLESIIIHDKIKNNDSKIFINTLLTNSFLLKLIWNGLMSYIQPNYKPKKINRTI